MFQTLDKKCIFKCFSFQINPDEDCPLGASGNAYIKTVWLEKMTFSVIHHFPYACKRGGGEIVFIRKGCLVSAKYDWFTSDYV